MTHQPGTRIRRLIGVNLTALSIYFKKTFYLLYLQKFSEMQVYTESLTGEQSNDVYLHTQEYIEFTSLYNQ